MRCNQKKGMLGKLYDTGKSVLLGGALCLTGCAKDYNSTLGYSNHVNAGYLSKGGSNTCLNYRGDVFSANFIGNDEKAAGDFKVEREFNNSIYDVVSLKYANSENESENESKTKLNLDIPLVESRVVGTASFGINTVSGSSYNLTSHDDVNVETTSEINGTGVNFNWIKFKNDEKNLRLSAKYCDVRRDLEVRINGESVEYDKPINKFSFTGEIESAENVNTGFNFYNLREESGSSNVYTGWGCFKLNDSSVIAVSGSYDSKSYENNLAGLELTIIMSYGNSTTKFRGVTNFIRNQLPFERLDDGKLLDYLNMASDINHIDFREDTGRKLDLILRQRQENLEAMVMGTYLFKQKDNAAFRLSGGIELGAEERALFIMLGVEK